MANMFGKKNADYVRFQSGILILIAAVFILRLALSLAGVPTAQVKWVSVNLALLVGLVYASVRVHTAGFGSYKQLLGLLFVQMAFAHVLIALAIVLAIVTGHDNVFTAPEYGPPGNGRALGHAGLHIIAPIPATLVFWGVGSVILFITKRVRHR